MDEEQLALLYTSAENLNETTKEMLGRFDSQITQLREARVGVAQEIEQTLRRTVADIASTASAVAAANAEPTITQQMEQLFARLARATAEAEAATNHAASASRLLATRGVLALVVLVLVAAGGAWAIHDGARAELRAAELRPQLELAAALRAKDVVLGCTNDHSCFIVVRPDAKPVHTKDGKSQWLVLTP